MRWHKTLLVPNHSWPMLVEGFEGGHMQPRDTILLVEDNDDDVFLFRRAVERSNCEADVCHCDSAAAAMQHLDSLRHENRPLPRLVFIDLLLPNVRGTHLVTWMRDNESYRAIPVILMTGAAPANTTADLAKSGANAIMLKPMQTDQLVEAVAAVCTLWLKYCLYA